MKKIVLAITAALALSMGAMAQDEQRNNRRERGQFNQEEMIQRSTDATVQRYGLNEEQAKKLLELNKKFANQMFMRRGPQGMQGRPDRRQNNDSVARPQRGPRPSARRDSLGGRPRGMQGGNPEQMRQSMEAYEAGIKEILTEDQYKAFQEDQKNRRQRGGGQGRGPRQR